LLSQKAIGFGLANHDMPNARQPGQQAARFIRRRAEVRDKLR
jgi:hypothetical protein